MLIALIEGARCQPLNVRHCPCICRAERDAVKLKQLAKLALAASPLVLGIATPASGCLCTPNDGQATENSDQIEDGPECSGPTAPWEKMQEADERNANDQGFSCDPMCVAGEWEDAV